MAQVGALQGLCQRKREIGRAGSSGSGSTPVSPEGAAITSSVATGTPKSGVPSAFQVIRCTRVVRRPSQAPSGKSTAW